MAPLEASLLYASSATTYEATRAQQSTRSQPDKIHWDDTVAFRDSPYRQLHHQRGVMGVFRIRLLEGADLKRSYWSPLAVGPVRHLGLSKAHGAVSSYCTFSLNCARASTTPDMVTAAWDMSSPTAAGPASSYGDRKAAPNAGSESPLSLLKKPPPATTAVVAASSGAAAGAASAATININKPAPTMSSPVVPADNHPVWDFPFEFPLRKGFLPEDGMRILLTVRVDEDATPVEQWVVPGILPSDARILGMGQLDLTDLCLGETVDGQVLPGVLDAWIPIALPSSRQQQQNQTQQQPVLSDYYDPLAPPVTTAAEALQHHAGDGPPPDRASSSSSNTNSNSNTTGKIRVLVSYAPIGMEPQPKDIVALEAFARRNPGTSSCRPLLPPLRPLTVIERRGAYLLCEYTLADWVSSSSSSSRHSHHHGSLRNGHHSNGGSISTKNQKKAHCRVHRNAVFVIERQNLADAAHNLALLPVDVVLSTPLGRATAQALGPVAAAGQELIMPAVLSLKLLWLALRTTTLAGFSGLQALGGTLWQEGTSSLTASHRRGSRGGGGSGDDLDGGGSYHSTGSGAASSSLAPFAQL